MPVIYCLAFMLVHFRSKVKIRLCITLRVEMEEKNWC